MKLPRGRWRRRNQEGGTRISFRHDGASSWRPIDNLHLIETRPCPIFVRPTGILFTSTFAVAGTPPPGYLSLAYSHRPQARRMGGSSGGSLCAGNHSRRGNARVGRHRWRTEALGSAFHTQRTLLARPRLVIARAADASLPELKLRPDGESYELVVLIKPCRRAGHQLARKLRILHREQATLRRYCDSH
jgi:hypothetical protein